jgi:hypothetical protein
MTSDIEMKMIEEEEEEKTVKCPICKAQKIESRACIDERDTRAHLDTLHIKREIVELCAKLLWDKQ